MDTFPISVIAKIKNGILWEAMRKRGWNIRQTAEFLGICFTDMYAVMRMDKKMPFIFSERECDRERRRKTTEKLMEFTGLTVEEIFPEAIRTKGFLESEKEVERTVDVPLDHLLPYEWTLSLPASPSEELMAKEDEELTNEALSELSGRKAETLQSIISGKTFREIADQRKCHRTCVDQQAKTGLRSFFRKKELLIAKRNSPFLDGGANAIIESTLPGGNGE